MTETGAGQGEDGQLVYWWSPRGTERVFDLSSWPEEPRQVARSLLEGAGWHRWEADQLVVAADARQDTQDVLDEVVAASQPRLEADEDRTAYELADWPESELAELADALEREGILHEWTEAELLVYEVDEARVDALFEELDLHGPEDGRVLLDGEELNLSDAFVATDKLARDAREPDAVVGVVSSAGQPSEVATPVGFDDDTWNRLTGQLAELAELLARTDDTVDDEEVSSRAEHPGSPARMDLTVLAHLELYHSRPIAPTRRLALGSRNRPLDPAPGPGSILLGGIAARFGPVIQDDVEDEELELLMAQLERGMRVVQPRLRHRLQADRVGLLRGGW